jgi:polysaccharide biosynthesis transport protein
MTIESDVGHEALNSQQATGLHLRQLINLLRRRWKLIITVVGVAVGLAGAVGLVFPPRFTAIAQVIVDPPRGSSGVAEPSFAGVLDDAGVLTHVAALLSQNHVQHVFDSLVAEWGTRPKERRRLLPDEEFSFDTFTLRINAFKDTHSRMIGVTYLSTDPAFAAAVANRSVELYLATLTERNIADRNDALRGLSKRIPLVRAEVVRAEAALQSYRIKHGLTEATRTDVVDQQLVDLNRQLAVARSDLAELHGRPTASTIGQTASQAQLAAESSTLETRVQQLERRIGILQDASTEVREPEARLRELQREATTFAQLYDGLVQRQKAILEGGDVQPDVRVISPAAVPTLPSSLNPLLFIPPAIVIALIGAGLLAVLLDQLDGTLRNERDVTDVLGISCIGVTPQFTRGGKLRMNQLISQDARYAEAIGSVAAVALRLTDPKMSSRTFLVTSSVPGEGKTTLAISFAVYAARLQRRVLLIDLSFRNPSVAKELGAPAAGGILQVLQGRPPAELIRAAQGLGFDYLPLSGGPADPIATLADERLPKLLRQLEESYDCVVIDTASLLGATEARLLASMVDKVLFAVKWGSTSREVAQNALELLQRSAFGKDDLRDAIAAVITQVDLRKHARYRYGDFSENLLQLKPSAAGG